MNKIEFKQTSNIFINAGIVALHRYIKKYVYEYPDKHIVSENKLEKDKLVIQCDNLLDLLEDVYYFMGKEIYDTFTSKQLEEAKKNKANFYYKIDEDKFYSFPKINTYGLTHLFTNNAQGNTRIKENTKKVKDLKKELPELTQKIKEYFEKNSVSLLKKVYFNEPYTKITRLTIKPEFLEQGKQKCPILNESFKQLIEGINISPFISGISNFNSLLQSSEKKISWKAMYLIRFSPALAFYHYYHKTHTDKPYDRLICHFFNSNNLQNINNLSVPILYKSKIELQSQPLPYTSNFNFFDGFEDATFSSELSFLMLFTFYKRNFENRIIEENIPKTNEYFDPFVNHPFEKIPISIIYFRADKFSSTLRPNEYEEFSNVKFIFRFIYYLEHQKDVNIKDIWHGLKIKTEKTKVLKYDKAKYEERKIRAEVFDNILKGKSILNQIERLFYDSFNNRINGLDTGYRRYDKILIFLLEYEQTLKSNNMDKKLQIKAIKLGASIGYGIINSENGDKKTNAKSARKYLISIHKSRTLESFLDSLIRIENRFLISISREILENIDENNFMLIRQFTLISALNQINQILKPQKSNNN